MTKLEIALTAGLVGSFSTAILSYIVQQMLASKRRRDDEKRLAFVYLLKVTPLVALETLLKWFFNIFADVYKDPLKNAIETLTSKNGAYEPSHSFCVIAARLLKDEVDEKKRKDFRKNMESFRELADSYMSSFQIPLDLLSRMPRHAVLAYYNLEGALISLRSAVKQWMEWIETGDENLIGAETLFGQWHSINLLAESAKDLRAALIIKGRVKNSEADTILNKVIKQEHKHFSAFYFLRDKLKAAEGAVEKLLEETTDVSAKDTQI